MLVTRKGEHFACDRNDWQKACFFEQMYDNVYDQLVMNGVAIRCEPEWRDLSNNLLTEEEKDKAFGEKCDIQILHPDHFLTFDETGCNTNMKDDGQIGGGKFVVGRGNTPKTVAATNDRRFTMLPIVAADGQPVICVLIFAGESTELRADWEVGIDITVNPVFDAEGRIIVEENTGPGKYFPGGPVCNFRGQAIPSRTYKTPKGSITTEILIDILRVLDELKVFPRNGVNPVVLVDGHETRLKPDFIEYINNNEHKWSVNLGVPYCTNLWQSGDSSEQNGKFKLNWYKEKQQLLDFKRRLGLPFALGATDIMPLVNQAWSNSFAQVKSSKKAYATRGWSPPQ